MVVSLVFSVAACEAPDHSSISRRLTAPLRDPKASAPPQRVNHDQKREILGNNLIPRSQLGRIGATTAVEHFKRKVGYSQHS